MSPRTLPFQNTTVDEQQSVGEIMGFLNSVGFDDIVNRCRQGEYTIMAKHGPTVFQWDIKLDPIIEVLRENLSDRRRRLLKQDPDSPDAQDILQETRAQAQRIGWRLMREHVKALVDSIKLGVVTVAEAFAGNLLIHNKQGESVKLSDHITAGVASGNLDLPGFGIAALEDKREKS